MDRVGSGASGTGLMGVTTHGLDELIADLEDVAERGHDDFKKVLGRGAFNVKSDWRKRWEAIRSPRTHIPHLVRGIGYDLSEKPGVFSAHIGVDPTNRQAFLAEIIERGTLTSAPHPGAVPALEAEAPRLDAQALKVAVRLLEES